MTPRTPRAAIAQGTRNGRLSVEAPEVSTYTYQGYDGLRRSKHEPGGVLTTFVRDGGDYLQERS
jgi:hypothetical protein